MDRRRASHAERPGRHVIILFGASKVGAKQADIELRGSAATGNAGFDGRS